MTSPLKPPDGNWWNQPINRREGIWLGLAGTWSVIIFGWMSGFTRFGDQNPIGETYEVSASEFQDKFSEYEDSAEETDAGLVPPGDDVYIAGIRFSWQGTPVVLETGREYDFHLSSLDVQHGFSIRPEHALSQQMNFQVLPGYEWVLPMEFDEPGEYHIICNEFCGQGHRTMHGRIVVRDS
ncbi:cytochrome C oxidase subunit II [Halosolutus halophilus]|uniref:cytochrome C oxidase subunit II n=1 Tax=Halosolutus halophilus TaxID=1552990 RepID=UPI0022350C99|nr:cytochrome C oxidase subunit II [Halosolutus halophilus]